jgi:hypothetical protein
MALHLYVSLVWGGLQNCLLQVILLVVQGTPLHKAEKRYYYKSRARMALSRYLILVVNGWCEVITVLTVPMYAK